MKHRSAQLPTPSPSASPESLSPLTSVSSSVLQGPPTPPTASPLDQLSNQASHDIRDRKSPTSGMSSAVVEVELDASLSPLVDNTQMSNLKEASNFVSRPLSSAVPAPQSPREMSDRGDSPLTELSSDSCLDFGHEEDRSEMHIIPPRTRLNEHSPSSEPSLASSQISRCNIPPASLVSQAISTEHKDEDQIVDNPIEDDRMHDSGPHAESCWLTSGTMVSSWVTETEIVSQPEQMPSLPSVESNKDSVMSSETSLDTEVVTSEREDDKIQKVFSIPSFEETLPTTAQDLLDRFSVYEKALDELLNMVDGVATSFIC